MDLPARRSSARRSFRPPAWSQLAPARRRAQPGHDLGEHRARPVTIGDSVLPAGEIITNLVAQSDASGSRAAPGGLRPALDPRTTATDLGSEAREQNDAARGWPGEHRIVDGSDTEGERMLGFEGENAREKVIVLLTMCFALAMAMLDNTVVNVALPSIQTGPGRRASPQLQWVVDGYVLAFASLLLTGGILGDRYGRKKMFLIGLTVFTLVLVHAAGCRRHANQLIAFRALQGVGGALLIPGTLSIITVTFPPHERAKALGHLGRRVGHRPRSRADARAATWSSTSAGSRCSSSTCRSASSRSSSRCRTVTESVSEAERKLDVPGLVLGTSALFFVTYGLIEANQLGWGSPQIIGVVRPVRGAARFGFLYWELKNEHAMMPLRFFRIPAFSAGQHRGVQRVARDVRDVLLPHAVHAADPRVLAVQGRRRVPADDARDHRHGAERRAATRPQHGSRRADDLRTAPRGVGLVLPGCSC